jgi:hypothetical protein
MEEDRPLPTSDSVNGEKKAKRREFKDPLDKPGMIKLAKIHGSAQRVYKIPDDYQAESKIYFF